MPYFFLEHPADLRLRVEGKSLDELFVSALAGLTEAMKPARKAGGQGVKRLVVVEAADATSLLVDFLNEALARMNTDRETYTDVAFHRLNEQSLEAELSGYEIERFGVDVKAATYHEAAVKKDEQGIWRTDMVFDI